jgi:hypothetical protein
MGVTNDKLVIILRGQFGSIHQASKHIGLASASLNGMVYEPKKRRNLLKYLPQLIKATGLSVTELYEAITEYNILYLPSDDRDR